MASISRGLLTALKIIAGLFAAGYFLFVVACLLWWWAWTNTGEMNRERFKELPDTTKARYSALARAKARATDTVLVPMH